MLFDLAGRQAARIQRENLIVEAFKASLVLGDDLRLEGGVAVARHGNGEGAEVAFEGLGGLAVAGVAAFVAFGVVLGVAEVMGEFGLHGAFEQGFGELLEQAIFAEHVVGLFIVLEQFVNQIDVDRHSSP